MNRFVVLVAFILFVVNTSAQNVLRPILAGSLTPGSGGLQINTPAASFISGNLVYVINANSLEIINISDPTNPVHIGNIHDGDNGAILNNPSGIFVQGNYAYITNRGVGSLEIINVSNPALPRHVGSLTNGIAGANLNNALCVAVSDGHAYVGATYGLTVIDVSDPSAPLPKGFVSSKPAAIALSGNYAYVVGSNQLQIIDITNPFKPSMKGMLANGTGTAMLDGAVSIALSGNYAYVASSNSNALEIVNVSDVSNPIHVASLINQNNTVPLTYPTSVFVSGTHAFVTSSASESLEIVDISNPAQPLSAGSIVSSGGSPFDIPISVVVSGSNACVLSQRANTLQVVDVSTPDTPHVIGTTINGTGGVSASAMGDIATSGTHAYIATDTGLEVVDITSVKPRYITFIKDGDNGALLANCTSVKVAGPYAYVTSSSNNALEILDLTNPDAPVHLASITDGSNGALLSTPRDVFIQGNYAYVLSNNENSLQIIDITHPKSPVAKGNIVDGSGGANLSRPYAVFVSGNYAYVASYGSNALEIIDVSDPMSPLHAATVVAGNNVLLNSPSSVYVSNGYAYIVGNGDSQLQIVDIHNPLSPIPLKNFNFYSSAPAYGTPHAITISGNYCFITDSNRAALEILDISDPINPVLQPFFSMIDVTTSVETVTVVGNFAYVTTGYSLQVIALFVPPPPVALAATEVNSNSFNAEWVEYGYAPYVTTNYLVDVSTDNFATFLPGFEGLLQQGGSTVGITGLQPQTQYQYRLRTMTDDGTSDYSNTILVMTAPPAPTKLWATNVTQTSLVAHWNYVDGVTNYLFDAFYEESSFPQYIEQNQLTFIDSAALTGLSPGTTYAFDLRSTNSFANSAPNYFFVTTIPTESDTLPPTVIGQTLFTVNWTQVQGATEYLLDLSADNFSTFISHDSSATGGSLVLSKGIEAGNVYQFRLRAANPSGASGYSPTQQVLTVPPTPVAGPDNPVAGDTTVIAIWTSSKSTTGYYISGDFLDSKKRLVDFFINVKGESTTTLELPFSRSKVQWYEVAAYNKSGTSPNSNSVYVNLLLTGLSLSEAMQLYPNPAQNYITITIPTKQFSNSGTLAIVDALGRCVINDTLTESVNIVNISNLTAGFYIVEIIQGNMVYQGKFVKQ